MRAAVVILLVVACGKKQAAVPADADVRKIDAPTADAVTNDAPVAVAKPTVKKLVAAQHSTCAVLSDKTVRCWGADAFGQLGDGGKKDASLPVTPTLTGIEEIAFGEAHACALLDDGSVACWGKIGIGTRQVAGEPTAVPGVTNVLHVLARGAAGCATVKNDSMICWGDVNASGRVRTGSGATESRMPTPVAGLDHVVALSANGALRDDGGVYYVGADGAPVRTAIMNAAEIASSGTSLCARLESGVVQCVGATPLCAAPFETPKPAIKPTRPVAVKPAKAAKAAKGKKPGTSPKVASKRPVNPAKHELAVETLKLPAARHLAFDAGGVCVVTTAGRLQCLDHTNACKLEAPWPDLAKVDVVVDHCARTTEGAVKCWNVDGKKRVASTIAGAAGSTLLAAGTTHACALITDHVVCWGGNEHGELGRATIDRMPHPEAAPVKL